MPRRPRGAFVFWCAPLISVANGRLIDGVQGSSRHAWTYFEGAWHEGNPMIMGPMTHAPWLGSCVFDGARAFEGVAPDLDLHCQRIVRSAESFRPQDPEDRPAKSKT